MAKVTLDDLCLIDTNEIRQISRSHLAPDPECPRGALYNSPARFDPNDTAFDNLASGDYTCAKFKYWDEGSMFDDATPGLNCPDKCIMPATTDETATLFTWSKCLEEDWLVRFCKGANPVADPFQLVVDMYEEIRDCEEEKLMICMLLGIYGVVVAAEAAGTKTGLLADFTVANTDGTTDISIPNLAGAEGTLAISTDIYITSHILVKKLRGQGFEPFCCTDSGQRRNVIQPLLAPGGQEIRPMDKKFNKFFDLNGDQSKWLIIGLKNNSIAYKDGNPSQGDDLFRKWRPIEFNNPSDGCDPRKMYIRNRSAMHPCGFTYLGECKRCDDTRDHAFLADPANWAYAHTPDPYCGYDKACVTFICGTCPLSAVPVAPVVAEKAKAAA